MRIEINPRSLLNLEHICEVLYKLHPSVLNYLVDMERSLGAILGTIDLDNLSLEEREFLANNREEIDYSIETDEDKENKNLKVIDKNSKFFHTLKKYIQLDTDEDITIKIGDDSMETDEDEEYENSKLFHTLRKYIQLDTDGYIPMKISVEVEDPVIGKKVRELVEALEKTRAPEQFYLNKKQMDEDAYFAEGYGLTMNEEQKKKFDDFFWVQDAKGLEELLRKEKLYP